MKGWDMFELMAWKVLRGGALAKRTRGKKPRVSAKGYPRRCGGKMAPVMFSIANE